MKVIARMLAPEQAAAPIFGKPMMQWLLEEARRTNFIDAVFVLTGDKETAEIARASDCHVVFRDSGGGTGETGFRSRDQWDRDLHEAMYARCGSLGDVRVFLDYRSCLLTAEILEDMFVRLMEHMVADEIVPVSPVAPYLMIENSKTGGLFPLWVYYGLDRQDYPPLYRAGSVRIRHMLRSGNLRLLHHEVSPECVLQVSEPEDVGLVEYYLALRSGGRIVVSAWEKGSEK